jgi:tetrahydromethanopterin S-methyltransferase subunit B
MSNSRYELAQHEANLGRIEGQRKLMETNYMKSLDLIEKEMTDIDRRIGVAKSSVKRELLTKQYSYLEDMIGKLDEEFENKKEELDEIIKETKERMKILNEQINDEKNSLEYNIEQLKKYMNNPGTYTMTHVLEKVVNSLEILGEQKKKKKKSTSSS